MLKASVTILNSFVLVVLSLKYKALLLAMCSQKPEQRIIFLFIFSYLFVQCQRHLYANGNSH